MNHLKTRFQQIKEDLIKGGLGDGKSLRDIAKLHGVELQAIELEYYKGQKVEMEHTKDLKIAREIAKDHLTEDPEYYTKLATIENK